MKVVNVVHWQIRWPNEIHDATSQHRHFIKIPTTQPYCIEKLVTAQLHFANSSQNSVNFGVARIAHIAACIVFDVARVSCGTAIIVIGVACVAYIAACVGFEWTETVLKYCYIAVDVTI